MSDDQAVPLPPDDDAPYEPFVAASGERDVRVIRIYTQADLDAARAQGAATELAAIIEVASQLRATIPADHPKGAQASFADYLDVTRNAGQRYGGTP